VNAARPLPHDSPERRALAFLAELSQALTQSLDLNRTLRLAVSRIARFMKAEAVSLFLIDPKTGLLICRHCAGPVDITGLKLTVGQGVVGRAVSDDATQIVRDAQNDPRVHQSVDAETGFITKSILCTPLRTAQGVIGALEIINRRDGELFDEDDADILRLIAAPAALAIHSAQLAEGLIEQQRIKRELTLARQMQKSLLPKARRDSFPIVGVNLPANEISGDFYDYFPLADGRIGFVIADVSGKGLDAAFLMVRVTSMLRSTGRQAPKPSEWLANVNAELCGTLQDGRFVCAAVGIYDRATGDVVLASAGFPPALLYDGENFEEIEADGPPLGILPEAEYTEHRLPLGSRALYLFSDGATDVHKNEVHAADGERLGSQGLRGLIERYSVLSPEPRLRALLGDLKRLTLVDDTTILLVQEPRGKSAIKLLDLSFPAEAAQMRTVRAALRTALDSQEIGPELRDRLVLAVDEACTNIMRHAYGGECRETISLHLSREKDMLLFELRDQAPTVDASKLKPRDLSECRPGGLGLPFIDALMDEWKLRPLGKGGDGKSRGNVLRMMKRLTQRDKSSGDA
jgi:sigma-B regulation protein RsbU (phosphoserine phosphatase)